MRYRISAVILCVSCGGLDAATKLSDLEQGDIETLCSSVTPGTKDCGGGVTVTVTPADACATRVLALPSSCAATVGDYQSCFGDPCSLSMGCLTIAACGATGSSDPTSVPEPEPDPEPIADCQDNEQRCSANGEQIEICGRGRWFWQEDCSGACRETIHGPVCLSDCHNGETHCVGNAIEACIAGTWQRIQTCALPGHCAVTNAQASCELPVVACTEDNRRCQDNNVERCTQGAWVRERTCATAETCVDAGDWNGPTCQAPSPCEDYTQDTWICDGQELLLCSNRLEENRYDCGTVSAGTVCSEVANFGGVCVVPQGGQCLFQIDGQVFAWPCGSNGIPQAGLGCDAMHGCIPVQQSCQAGAAAYCDDPSTLALACSVFGTIKQPVLWNCGDADLGAGFCVNNQCVHQTVGGYCQAPEVACGQGLTCTNSACTQTPL